MKEHQFRKLCEDRFGMFRCNGMYTKDDLKFFFAAGQAAERDALQAKIDDLSVWCESVQSDIVYCYQIDEMIRKRGEN